MSDPEFTGLNVGDVIHLDPRALPELRIITEEEADTIDAADPCPRRQFIVSWGKLSRKIHP